MHKVTVTANVDAGWEIHMNRRPAAVERAYFYVHHLISICSGAKHKCQQEDRTIERSRICGGCVLSCVHLRLMSEDECTNSKCSVVALHACACLSGFGRPHVEDNLHDGHCIESCRYLHLEYAEHLFVLVLVGRQTAVDTTQEQQ